MARFLSPRSLAELNPALMPGLGGSGIRSSERHFQSWQHAFNLRPVRLQPRREDERFAEMRGLFINSEPRALGREFKKNAARFLEINRLEPETIDHRCRTCALFRDPRAHLELMCFVVHAPRDMMNAAGSPGATPGGRLFPQVDISAGFSVGDTVTMPAVLRAKVRESHRLRKKRARHNEIALDHSGAFQTADLRFDRNRTSIPRRESAAHRILAFDQ